jgi:predicted nucleotidyltransferase
MKPTRNQELAVLRSVAYASLFDYPLTLAQLHTSLVGEAAEAHAIESWWRHSDLLQATVEYRDGLFFPLGRADLPPLRGRREKVSRELLSQNDRILQLMARTPFVRMVAVSGSLAHLNAEPSADLDVFVITAPGQVWSVTLSILVMARLLGYRRRLCLNYVVSERALAIEPADLFAANQIIHLKPISGRDVFGRFVAANPFVAAMYPNFSSGTMRPERTTFKTAIERITAIAAPVLERVARAVYGWHLRRRSSGWRSHDQVRLERECLKLHTTSHRTATLERYDAAVSALVRDSEKKKAALAS